MAETNTTARVLPRIADIGAAAWDALANPPGLPHDPFISHAFLKALEDAETVGRRTGWVPQHIVLEADGEGVIGVMPCYLKNHSKGEYIFDYGWADAFERAGGRYYPKLQCAVPFTPVPGRRLLVAPGPEAETREKLLLAAAIELTSRLDASSLHVTFLTEPEWTRAGSAGLLQRTDQQFHWHNANYRTFDDFLATLASRKRKAIRKERAQALEGGLVVERITGRDLTEAHWDAFFEFYMDTGSRKWGRPYLNRRFFSLLGATMPERCLLVLVKRGDHYIAGALNLIGGDCLYGRYWGATDPQPCLHFEVCYYQAIDFAIERGLARVEAGAQGEHKLARGYMPTPTYSVHWIADRGLRTAVARYLVGEREHMELQRRALAEYGPYRKGEGSREPVEQD
jgi:predicted N-acyltransferase